MEMVDVQNIIMADMAEANASAIALYSMNRSMVNVTGIYEMFDSQHRGINYSDLSDIQSALATPEQDNYWALLALILVAGTAAGNILVCLAIAWERRLQNVTNYFLMSLAITDLMVALSVMPMGILTLFKGENVDY